MRTLLRPIMAVLLLTVTLLVPTAPTAGSTVPVYTGASCQVAAGDSCRVVTYTATTTVVDYTFAVSGAICPPGDVGYGCTAFLRFLFGDKAHDTCGALPGVADDPLSGGYYVPSANFQSGSLTCRLTLTGLDYLRFLDESVPQNNGSYVQVGTVHSLAVSPVVAPQPSLTVAASATVPKGGLSIGGTVDVPVKVTAGPTAVGSLSVNLTGTTGRYRIVDAPKRTSGLALAANQTMTLTWTIEGVASGTGVVTARATGTASGAPVSASGATRVPVVSRDLSIVAMTGAQVHLAVDDKARVSAKRVTVSIAVKNTGKKRLIDVVLQRAWIRPVDNTQQLDQLDFAARSFPIRLGTLAPGSKATRHFTVVVTGDGKYKIDSLATYGLDKGNARVSASGGRFTAIVPPLYFTSTMSGGAGVKGGSSFYLTGRVKNVSSYKSLCLWPMYPKITGNAGGVGPVDTRTYGTGRDVIAPPASGELKPGQLMPIGMTLRTRSDGATRAVLALDPKASVLDEGERCDAITTPQHDAPLAAADETFPAGALLHRGVVDVSVPAAPPSTWYENAYDLGAGLTLGSISTLGDTLLNTVIVAREVFDGYTRNPQLLLPSLDTVYAVGGLITHYWELLSVDQKQDLATRVTGVLALAADDAWRSVYQGGTVALAPTMNKIAAAYGSGDMRALSYAIGYGSGSGITKVVTDLALAEIGIGLAKQVPVLARTFAAVAGESATFSTMKSMPVGKLINFAEGRSLWGAALEDWNTFRQIAKEENVLIGIRGRAPISVQNLEEGAVWKHEEIKPKNVSPIDVKYLGFRGGDTGLVAMRSYSKEEIQVIEARISRARLTANERGELLKRWQVRKAEVPEYLGKIEQLSKEGKINVGFNYSENGLGEPTTQNIRRFHLGEDELKSGSKYYTPWQESIAADADSASSLPKWCKDFGGAGGVLCRLTGDMDGVYLTDPAGNALSPDRVVAVYKRLAEAGWQHPETFTWVDQMTGDFFFNAKNKILKGLTKGGEKLMEFAPDGKVRAVWIDLEKSVGISPQDYFIARNGGLQSVRR